MGRDARWAILLGAPLVVAVVFSLARVAAEPFHVPAEEDYPAARAVLDEAGYAPAVDAWAVLPPWSLRAWKHLGDRKPMSGDGLWRRPLHRYARLFVVVEPDAGQFLQPLQQRLGPPAAEKEAGRLRVLRWDLGGPHVAFDFTAHVEDATVRILASNGAATPCETVTRGGKACAGRGAWMKVTRQWLLVSENGDEALWAHPPPPGQTLELRWDNVTLGPSIVVRAGHTREGADRATGEVRLHIKVDDREVGVVRRKPAFDFVPEEIPIPGVTGPGHTVTFQVETDQDATNHFVLDAYAVAQGVTP